MKRVPVLTKRERKAMHGTGPTKAWWRRGQTFGVATGAKAKPRMELKGHHLCLCMSGKKLRDCKCTEMAEARALLGVKSEVLA